MTRLTWLLVLGLAVAAAGATAAQTRPAPPATPRLYIFDGGSINGLDTKLFGFAPNEVKQPNFRVTSYLVVHPRGAKHMIYPSQLVAGATAV